jgi:hypothetical protein
MAVQSTYRFDRPWPAEFLAIIDSGDDLRIAIVGHVFIERILFAIIERCLPESLDDLDRLPFPAAVNLARALGAIDAETVETLRYLNRIRNNFAHPSGPRGPITPEEAQTFRNTLPVGLRRYVEGVEAADAGAWTSTRSFGWSLMGLYRGVDRSLEILIDPHPRSAGPPSPSV